MPDGLPMLPDVADKRAAERAMAVAHGARLGLSLKRQRFVEEYVLSGNGADACRRAGYSPRRADRSAQILLRAAPVQTAVKAIRAEIAERAGFAAEVAMRKLDDVIVHALKTENASAHCRAVELQARIAGVLVDRVDARVAIGAFVLNVIGLGEREAVNG